MTSRETNARVLAYLLQAHTKAMRVFNAPDELGKLTHLNGLIGYLEGGMLALEIVGTLPDTDFELHA